MKRILISLFVFTLAVLTFPQKSSARDSITDWYIKDFQSEISLNKDSSLTVTEKISADCGDLPDKHGIFRVIPEFYYSKDNEKIPARVSLISIKDFDGNDVKYTAQRDRANDTITFKIGDPAKTVTGLNNYEIKYSVKNVIHHGVKDELYWNLNGNFWDIETDRFSANVVLPEGITQNNSEVNIYAGGYGEKGSGLASYVWENNTIKISSNQVLKAQEGITLSVVFPDGIVNPHVPTFLEKYGSNFFYLIPLLVFLICLSLWRRFGKDPKDNPTIVPEFEIPEDLSPMEMGVILSDGIMKTNYVSAGIINIAVKGHLKIEEIPKKGILGAKDYSLTLTESRKALRDDESILLEKIFKGQKVVFLSTLKNNFFTEYNDLGRRITQRLSSAKILYAYSRNNQAIFMVLGIMVFISSFFFTVYDIHLGNSMLASGVLLIIFSFLMRRRTAKGLKLFRRIQGFKLYMETAEKYRQQFNEKENIFEKFLSYAIMFGMTKQWINKMKDIYGDKYFDSYHPIWFYGYAFANFNVDSLNSAISDMSSNIATTMASSPSSSGAGGGGFSGGGGGGGGGGGW